MSIHGASCQNFALQKTHVAKAMAESREKVGLVGYLFVVF